jgi:hypothetical protein
MLRIAGQFIAQLREAPANRFVLQSGLVAFLSLSAFSALRGQGQAPGPLPRSRRNRPGAAAKPGQYQPQPTNQNRDASCLHTDGQVLTIPANPFLIPSLSS